MATEVVHLNGSKHLDCLLRELQIDSIRVDKKRCSSLNGVWKVLFQQAVLYKNCFLFTTWMEKKNLSLTNQYDTYSGTSSICFEMFWFDQFYQTNLFQLNLIVFYNLLIKDPFNFHFNSTSRVEPGGE